jgi:glycosyltransferase involved in cell wall biosynthesis
MVLTERACGWVAQPDAEPLARALATAVAMDVGQRRVMGEAGRRLVVDEFDWHGVDRRMVALYRSVAGRTGKKAEVAAAVSGR